MKMPTGSLSELRDLRDEISKAAWSTKDKDWVGPLRQKMERFLKLASDLALDSDERTKDFVKRQTSKLLVELKEIEASATELSSAWSDMEKARQCVEAVYTKQNALHDELERRTHRPLRRMLYAIDKNREIRDMCDTTIIPYDRFEHERQDVNRVLMYALDRIDVSVRSLDSHRTSMAAMAGQIYYITRRSHIGAWLDQVIQEVRQHIGSIERR
jgi:hypothetical protein